MNRKIKTSIAFAKNLFVTGAIIETSRVAEIEICKYLPKENNKIIVEYGMGHGNITREILKNMAPNSKLYAFEVKKSFCEYVSQTISDSRLTIINDDAENISKHVKENIDAVIGSLPYSLLSKRKSYQIIRGTYDKMVNNAYYSQVLYTKFNFKKFEPIFNRCWIQKLKGTPTEYIYHCKKELN